MPRKRQGIQVRCIHFTWILYYRGESIYADGRANTINAGRHSLDTKDLHEAQKVLPELDQKRAEDLGIVPISAKQSTKMKALLLAKGRVLYEGHVARPKVAGGTKKSTQKRYRTVFDKFIPFISKLGVTTWNGVQAPQLTAYAAFLEKEGYARKSIVNEITTLKQAVKWLIKEGHISGSPIELKLRRAESRRAYCYRPQEVKAIVEYCRNTETLHWLGDVTTALACTGLRIAELANLRWEDVDLNSCHLLLSDESGWSERTNSDRRETKSGRSRSFPVHPDLADVLSRIPKLGAYIFYGPRGGRIKPDTVRRILVREVIDPLNKHFPCANGARGFSSGRLHSFRHYFCSTCANNGVPERIVMDWLGHADSEMIRHYYHLHDEESKRRMNNLDFLGTAGGRSVSKPGKSSEKEEIIPPSSENRDDFKPAD